METKKCKKCQKSIDKNLRFCPKCGEKQPEPVWATALVIFFAVVVIFGGLTGFEDEDTLKTPEEKTTETVSASEEKDDTKKTTVEEEKRSFKVGEVLETQGLKITFDSNNLNFTNYSQYASVSDGHKIVEFKFTAENISERDRSFNYYDFNCYADDQKMQQFYSVENSGLESGGTISAGKKSSVPVYCEVPITASKITVEYQSLLSNKHYEFVAS